MNEEEIRGKLLLPYISDLGFDLSEISLEKSFTIRIGKSKQVINGRSDILCRRNGKNLFVIELKSDSIFINQADIDQGISYARLLDDNIAPFTIITNGKITRVFDSITREELNGTKISNQSSYWKNEFTLSTDIDLQIRYEALKNFVSLSPENLRIFCEDQVRDRMGPIIGKIDDDYAKFVKELYFQRQGLQSAFDNFISSEASVFGIIGSAGVGKTSAICSLVLQKLEHGFVFFYNAAIINKSPLEHIAQDLNGVFSTKSESETVLKKLDELGRFINKTIVIFIDAIDESTNPSLAIELSEISLAVRSLQKVKICVSCKLNIWNNILKKNDTPTHLFEELNKFHNLVPSAGNCPGFLLEDFNHDEVVNIIPLYRDVFGFKGQISKSLLNDLKNGFFLRIFSEVYSQRDIPNEINDKELIGRYIKKSLKRTSLDFQVGLRILSKIGEILINHKYTAWEAHKDEGLGIESIIEKLQFGLEESIPEALFARNILTKSNKEDSYNISFYYSKIRDYIICFYSYKLDKLNDDEFYNLLEKFYENYIGQSALSFYIENASDNHKRALIKFKSDKSLKYVTNYELYLDKHFKIFKVKFEPYTESSIGIFLPKDLLQEDGYALFRLGIDSTNKVQYESLESDPYKSYDRNSIFTKGVAVVHGSNKRLLTSYQDKTIQQYVFKQLREIIDNGKISAYNSDILLLEQISTIIYFYYQKLNYAFNLKDFYLPRFDLIYPIDLEDLRERLFKFLVTEYYNRQYLEPKLRLNKIDEALQCKSDVPKLDIGGDFPPFEELFKIVEILLKKGYREIAKHHLPCPDISISEAKTLYESHFDIPKIRSLQFSQGQAKLYIETFLKHFDSCYKEFVEYFFPTFKEKLPFFSTLPHEYFVYMKDLDNLKWGYLGYRPSESGEVKVNFKEFPLRDEPFDRGETKILHAFSFDLVLHSYHLHVTKTIDRINTPKVDDYCVLRNWVFKFLKDDMKMIFAENKE